MSDLKKMVYRKTNRSTSKSYEVDSHMLDLLIAIDGKKSVHQVAREVKMPSSVFKTTFLKLAKMGLIKLVEAKEPTANETFMESMSELLTDLMGPLGGVLIDDTAEAMGFDANHIPLSRLGNFIENLSREIPHEKQRNAFKEKMVHEMRSVMI